MIIMNGKITLGDAGSNDTVRLLRECGSGVKMGVSAIEDVVSGVSDTGLRAILNDSLEEHRRLEGETRELLRKKGEPDRDPPAMAKSMSKMKTEIKMTLSERNAAAADVITDGCNMGVKSLSKYLNEYKAADERSKDIAKKLISMESDLSIAMRPYL